MVEEFLRLVSIKDMAGQQFGKFRRLGRKNCGVPQRWLPRLDSFGVASRRWWELQSIAFSLQKPIGKLKPACYKEHTWQARRWCLRRQPVDEASKLRFIEQIDSIRKPTWRNHTVNSKKLITENDLQMPKLAVSSVGRSGPNEFSEAKNSFLTAYSSKMAQSVMIRMTRPSVTSVCCGCGI
jgi:hypothetical protein